MLENSKGLGQVLAIELGITEALFSGLEVFALARLIEGMTDAEAEEFLKSLISADEVDGLLDAATRFTGDSSE
jgi:hypothetical protein